MNAIELLFIVVTLKLWANKLTGLKGLWANKLLTGLRGLWANKLTGLKRMSYFIICYVNF